MKEDDAQESAGHDASSDESQRASAAPQSPSSDPPAPSKRETGPEEEAVESDSAPSATSAETSESGEPAHAGVDSEDENDGNDPADEPADFDAPAEASTDPADDAPDAQSLGATLAAAPDLAARAAQRAAESVLSFKWLRSETEVRWMFVFALAIRALAAWMAPAIRNDSFDLLEVAQRMRVDGVATVLESSHHPASPWLISELSRWFPLELAGTGLAVFGGALAVWPLHGIARHVAGRHAATAACVFYAALPTAIQVTSVPMDEGVYLPLLLTAVALLLGAAVAPRGWPRNARLLGCGLAAGGAYLCRPEGLVLGAALVALALLRARSRWAFARVGLVLGGLALVAVPYIALLTEVRGRFEVTPKKSLAVFFGQKAVPAATRAAQRVADQAPGLADSLAQTVEALASSLSIPLALLALAGLMARARWRHRKPRAARLLVLALALPLLAAVARLNAGWGYGGDRHALSAALLLLPFAGEGLYRLGGMFSRTTSRRRFTVFLAVLLAMPLATRGLFLARGRGSGRAAHLGREIALRNVQSAAFDRELVIASFSEPLVAYYADRAAKVHGGRARHVRLLRDFGPLLSITRDLVELRKQLAERLREEEVDFVVMDLYARDRSSRRDVTRDTFPGRELIRVLQADGVLEEAAIATGSEIAAFRVKR